MGRRGQHTKCETLKLQNPPQLLRAEHRGREAFLVSVTLLTCSGCADTLEYPQTHNHPCLPSCFAGSTQFLHCCHSLVTFQSRLCALLGCRAGRVQGTLAVCLQQAVPDIYLGTTGTLSTESCSCLAFSLASTCFRLGQHGEDGF